MNHANIINNLKESHKRAGDELAFINGQKQLTKHCFSDHMRQFILAKFLLDTADLTTDDFNEITEISLARGARLSPDVIAEFDTAQSCDGATSAMVKRVLLFRTIEKGLDVTLDTRQSVLVSTLDDVTDMVWCALRKSKTWKDRIIEE